MFPNFFHQVLILLAVLAAGLVMLSGVHAGHMADGASGFSLLLSASPVRAVGIFIPLIAAGVLLGLAAGLYTHPMAGPFVLGAGLIFPAVSGGSIEGWIRSIDSSARYWPLEAENLIWAALILSGLWLLMRADAVLSGRLGKAAQERRNERRQFLAELSVREDALGLMRRASAAKTASEEKQPEPAGADADLLNDQSDPWIKRAGGMGVAAGLGSLLTAGLLQEADVGQVAWGVGAAFMVSVMVAHQMFPTAGFFHLLVSPFLAAAGFYGLAAVFGGDSSAILYDLYAGRFFHGALALPVFYASAGLAGAAMGAGWSEGLYRGTPGEKPAS